MDRVTEAEAALNFSELVAHVHDTGEPVEVVRDGAVVARIMPPAPAPLAISLADLSRQLAAGPRLAPADAEDFLKLVDGIRGDAVLPEATRWD